MIQWNEIITLIIWYDVFFVYMSNGIEMSRTDSKRNKTDIQLPGIPKFGIRVVILLDT